MRELPLYDGRVALVDDDVWEWAGRYRWRVHPQGYVFRDIRLPNGRRRASFLRREIMHAPRGVEVRHRNGDQLDCRRENLVAFTPAERGAQWALRRHREGLRTNNSSGFRGVSWDRAKRAWRAAIGVSGRLKHLGFFPTPEAAARAWDSAAREAWGEVAFQNFGPPGSAAE